MIDGKLWCSEKSNIHIYNTKLERERVIILDCFDGILGIAGIAEVNDEAVAVATSKGLVIIDKQGIVFWSYIIIYLYKL